MKSNYKRLGGYIQEVNIRNSDTNDIVLLGVSIKKIFIPSIANIIGTDMSTYKIIKKEQFAYGPVTSRNGDKISIALLEDYDEAIISQAYISFEIKNKEELLPEYLMMWFRRPEFDRYARFMSHGSARETFCWDEMCDVRLPVPSIIKQREIVKEYRTIVDRINLNNRLIQKLEETAQAIYKQWFVDFEFPDEKGMPYKSNGGEIFESEFGDIPDLWRIINLSCLSDLKYGKMLNEDDFTEAGYPVYSGYGIRGFYKEYLFEDPQILVIARGVSGTGEVKLSPPKCYITNLSIVVEIKKDLINRTYLYYFLKNSNLRSLDSGSAQSQITINDLNNVKILYPPIEVQNSAAKIIDTLLDYINIKNKEYNILFSLIDILLARLTIER